MISPPPLASHAPTATCRDMPAALEVIDPAPAELASAPEPSAPAHSGLAPEAGPDTILRFLLGERLLHWAIAIPFLGCFLSALVLLLVFNHNPTGAYRPIFAWMHRGCGAALLLGPSLVLLASGEVRIHLYNVRQAWVWRLDDIKWLVLMGPAAVLRRVALPDQGKFNAAEKLNFMMVMVFPPLFIATGLLIWFPDHTPLGSFGAWLIHCALAAAAAPLVLGHIIMATVNPSTRVGLTGMVSGFVSREWAAHHYARWFREQFPHLVNRHDNEPRPVEVPEATANPASGSPEHADAMPVPAAPSVSCVETELGADSPAADRRAHPAEAPHVPALGAQYPPVLAARSIR